MTVRVNVHNECGTIVLDRPDKRNAISRQLMEDLDQALGDLHQERKVRAVVLTGAGTAFCAGMDLGEMLDTHQLPNPYPRWEQDALMYRNLLEKMLRFPKPLIAAVNGPAMAGGAGLMLACDVVIAGGSARFGLPEPKRGLVAGVVAPLVTFRIAGGHAARLLVTGMTVEATEGHRIGLFHELVGDDQVWARAQQVAAECAQGARESLQLTKRMLNETIGEHLFTLLSAGAAMSAAARTTEAANEGLTAFREKREPKWP